MLVSAYQSYTQSRKRVGLLRSRRIPCLLRLHPPPTPTPLPHPTPGKKTTPL